MNMIKEHQEHIHKALQMNGAHRGNTKILIALGGKHRNTHTDTKIHKVILTGAKESAQKSVLSRCCFIFDSLSRLPHSSQPPPRYPFI